MQTVWKKREKQNETKNPHTGNRKEKLKVKQWGKPKKHCHRHMLGHTARKPLWSDSQENNQERGKQGTDLMAASGKVLGSCFTSFFKRGHGKAGPIQKVPHSGWRCTSGVDSVLAYQALGTILAKQKAFFEWIIVLGNILATMIQARVTWEEGPQLRKCLHQMGYSQTLGHFPD